MQENNGINAFYNLFITIGGVFGVLNIVKYFKKAPESLSEQYEQIIAEKDKIIAEYEKKIKAYQKLLEHDNEHNKLE